MSRVRDSYFLSLPDLDLLLIVRIQIQPKIKEQICFYSTVTSINLLYLKTYVIVGTLGKYLQLEI